LTLKERRAAALVGLGLDSLDIEAMIYELINNKSDLDRRQKSSGEFGKGDINEDNIT
jgi:hypothetical protein